VATVIVVGAVLVQVLVATIETMVSFIGATVAGPPGSLFQGLGAELVQGLVQALTLGVGLFVALRFVTPVRGEDSWRHVLRTALLATLFAMAVFVIVGVVVTLVQSTSPGAYPFGYAFTPAFNSDAAIYGLIRVVAGVPGYFVEWFAFVLVAAGFEKIWLSAHPETESLQEGAPSAP
jgi:uncharacterized membrane-anchored protein